MAREDTQFKIGSKRVEGSGIKKGQKQRSTEMVIKLFDFFDGKWDDLDKSWEKLSAKDRWEVYIKCLKYMVPSVSSVNIGSESGASSIRSLIMMMANREKED